MQTATTGVLKDIPAARIIAGTNDRTEFDDHDLQALAESIHKHGLIHRPIVRAKGDLLEIVVGERRTRAMRDVLGWRLIPVEERELTDEQAADHMLAENASRADLNPVEEARAFAKRLKAGQTKEHIAQVGGYSVDYVTRRASLLTLRDDILHLVGRRAIPIGVAEAMVDLDHNRQLAAFKTYQQAGGKMLVPAFRALCAEMLAIQLQQALFDDDDLFLKTTPVVPEIVARSGHQTRTSAPYDRTLPSVPWTTGYNAGDAMEGYMHRLEEAGYHREAAAIGNLYRTLLYHNYASLGGFTRYPAGSHTPTIETELHEGG